MCFEENKKRIYFNKPKNINNQPLIKDKRLVHDHIKQKENQKINVEMLRNKHTYITSNYRNQYEVSQNQIFTEPINIPINKNNAHFHRNEDVQSNQRILTFGTAKNQLSLYKQQSKVMGQNNGYQNNYFEAKKPLITAKPVNFLDKFDKNTNYQKNLHTQRQRHLNQNQKNLMQKKQKVTKQVLPPSTQNILMRKVSQNTQLSQIDDFACTQELDLKPVEKKSLVPQKKEKNSQKTTSKFDFVKSKKIIDHKNDVKQLKDFETIEKSINLNTEAESLMFMTLKQEQYMVSPGFLQKTQKFITWWSRAVLVDWMRHICFEFALQRDTYHIAVVLLDNYISKTPNIPKSIFQALGVTTLFIASKLQEFQCKQSAQFAKTTNNSCTVGDIHELEIKIVKALKFKINPPTINSLANKIMIQWDAFINSKDMMTLNLPFRQKVRFKTMDQNSYRMFRTLMQLLDCSVIDVQTAQYKPKLLVCSFIYLLLGIQYEIFDTERIVKEFPGSSLYLLEENSEFNDLFRSFVEYCFGFSLFEILPTVQYAATYFDLNFTFEKPLIAQEDSLDTMSLEEYCSYQSFNSGMLKAAKNRYRGIY